VVVVGAGPAGLAVAAQLRRAGLDPLVLDRSATVASAWRTRYDSFRLHTIRWLSALPGMRIPKAYGAWVSRDDFLRYLEGYASRFGIAPQLDTELHGVDRTATGWVLHTSRGDLEARRVVLATGACAHPEIPDWPGRTDFVRPLTHSSDYRHPGPYRGRRVLVVGSGNSATEVAVDLAVAGDVTVELAVRTAPAILRRDLAGFPTQPLGIALRGAPAAVGNPLAAALRKLTIPDLAAQGLPAPHSPYSQFQRTGTVPVLDHGFVAAVRSGAIVVRSGVAALDGSEVVHSDGTRSTPDAVIAATGYRSGLDPILGPLGLVDDRGLPTIGAAGDPARAPGLHSVGISILLSGLLREIGKDTERLVRSLAIG
jgi:cation diffusion facilitator CzcD-associated flavoprotein CzcO